MCLCVCVLVCWYVLIFYACTVCLHKCMFTDVQLRKCVAGCFEKQKTKLVHDGPFFMLSIFTTLTNNTQSRRLEATNVPVSKLTRSATHVSDNQATFQPLDSRDPSTLHSLSFACSSLSTLHLLCSLFIRALRTAR